MDALVSFYISISTIIADNQSYRGLISSRPNKFKRHCQCVSVKVNIDCQFSRILNYLEDKLLSMLVCLKQVRPGMPVGS